MAELLWSMAMLGSAAVLIQATKPFMLGVVQLGAEELRQTPSGTTATPKADRGAVTQRVRHEEKNGGTTTMSVNDKKARRILNDAVDAGNVLPGAEGTDVTNYLLARLIAALEDANKNGVRVLGKMD